MIRGERGFVTIATGSEHYYRLAVNLLHSYQLNTDASVPFAIIAEEKNKYTDEFDDVILMKNPTHSYMDKLILFDYLPYEETIFIDADCLVYGNIIEWWEMFGKGDDFSYFGYAYEDLNTQRGWFKTAGMKEFKDQIKYVPSGSSGICYLRNTETCKKVFDIAKYAATHYYDYDFALFKKPADEPVISLGMAVMDCRPLDVDDVSVFNKTNKFICDILKGTSLEIKKDGRRETKIIHWGNPSTKRSLYLFEVAKLNRYLEHRQTGFMYKILYEKKLLYGFYHVFDLIADLKGLNRRLKKKFKAH